MPEDIIAIGPETFSNIAGTVISHKGNNYYLACGSLVRDVNGIKTYCVKRIGHSTVIHEDFFGHMTHEPSPGGDQENFAGKKRRGPYETTLPD